MSATAFTNGVSSTAPGTQFALKAKAFIDRYPACRIESTAGCGTPMASARPTNTASESTVLAMPAHEQHLTGYNHRAPATQPAKRSSLNRRALRSTCRSSGRVSKSRTHCPGQSTMSAQRQVAAPALARVFSGRRLAWHRSTRASLVQAAAKC